MITRFLTPPESYYLIGFVIIVSLLVYWKREPIKRELRRWRAKEISVGPAKFERQGQKKTSRRRSNPKTGVKFGPEGDFSGARISGIAGRDIVRDSTVSSGRRGTTPGVNFTGGSFKDAEIEDIAGRDIIESMDFPEQEPPDEESSL